MQTSEPAAPGAWEIRARFGFGWRVGECCPKITGTDTDADDDDDDNDTDADADTDAGGAGSGGTEFCNEQ